MLSKKVTAAEDSKINDDLEVAGAYFSFFIGEKNLDVAGKVKLYKKAAAYFLEKKAWGGSFDFENLVGYLTAIRFKAGDTSTEFYLKKRFPGVSLFFVDKSKKTVIDYEGLVDLKSKQNFHWTRKGSLFSVLSPNFPKRQETFSYLMKMSMVERNNETLVFPLLPWLANLKHAES
jgi:hypothetical protein